MNEAISIMKLHCKYHQTEEFCNYHRICFIKDNHIANFNLFVSKIVNKCPILVD